MKNILDYPIGKDFPEKVNVIVEVPMGSRNKYEMDKDSGMIVLDRVLYTAMEYPVNYGFIPQTWWEDEDPLDAMVISAFPVHPGVVIEGKVLGLLRMEDEKGIDDKILLVNTKDPRVSNINSLEEVPQTLLDEIAHFFERYKELEKGKWVKVKGWLSKEEAIKIVQKAHEMYKEKFRVK